MLSRKQQESQDQREFVLLEVLENAHQLLQDVPRRKPTIKLCLAPTAALLLASQASNSIVGRTHFEQSEESQLASDREELDMTMIELTEIEIQQLKEQNHRRIKRVVTVVAITMMIISFVLVALSLSLGPKIDQLVSESLDTTLSSKDLFLGPKRNETGVPRT